MPHCLIRLGARQEAAGLLAELKDEKYHRIWLYRAFHKNQRVELSGQHSAPQPVFAIFPGEPLRKIGRGEQSRIRNGPREKVF